MADGYDTAAKRRQNRKRIGRIVIGGSLQLMAGQWPRGLARLHADGSIDGSFTDDSTRRPSVISVMEDGKILIGGTFFDGFARLNADGSRDDSFEAQIERHRAVYSIIDLEDGTVLIGGSFQTVNGEARGGIARIFADGSLDDSFGDSRAGTVIAIAADNGGRILIGGSFREVAGAARKNIALLNPDGSLDSTFDNGPGGPDAELFTLAVQSNGGILMSGSF